MTRNRVLWTLQVLLALLFLVAGGVKLAIDPAELAAQSQMPAALLQVVSVCEILGAIGLVVPWLTGIRPALTPLAATGLIVIMIGAVVTTLVQGLEPAATALFPFVIGLLLAFVAYGRSRGLMTYPLPSQA